MPKPLYVTNEEIIHLKSELVRMQGALQRLDVPIYHLHGKKDWLVPFENVYYTAAVLKHVELNIEVLPDANHFTPWTHPEEVLKGIRWLYQRAKTKQTKINDIVSLFSFFNYKSS